MIAAALALCGWAADSVQVGPGSWTDPFPTDAEAPQVDVGAFLLGRDPVTVAELRAFVVGHPSWQRGAVSTLFADAGYLASWAGPEEPGADVDPLAPVTQVSWFAARAYCASVGGRLPTVAEWELAAQPSGDSPEERERLLKTILDWYARPTPARLPPVGAGEPNAWGARDLHGLVWEWVDDFNSSLVSGDSREGGADDALFCGAGALGAANPSDYAAFMRVAFRSSLRGDTTTRGLGFRCAWDLEGT